MSVKATDLLSCLFVYCPEIRTAEGEEFNKLLFYYPKTDAPNIQVQNFSFCEAVVKFTKTFSTTSSEKFYEIKTSKSHCVCCCFEEKFYLGAFFDLTSAEARDYALDDQVLRSVLRRAIDTFRLFFGSAGKLFARDDSGELKARFDYFFTRYFMTLRLSLFPLMDLLGGIKYAHVDPVRFLDVQCIVNRMMDMYAFLKHVLIIQDDSLVYSSVAGSNLATFYSYLVVNLLPVSNRIDLTADSLRSAATGNQPTSTGLRYGKFTTGVDCEPASTKIPNLFMRKDDGGESDSSSSLDYFEYSLVLYKVLNITVALLLFSTDAQQLKKTFYSDFDSSFGPEFLSTLGGGVSAGKSETASTAMTTTLISGQNDENSRFFYYFNRSTFEYKCSATATGSVDSKYIAQMPRAVRLAVCNLHRELRSCDYFGDVFAKVDSDCWVAAKKAGVREVYAVFALKNAHLTDISEEMRKLCAVDFDGVFLAD